MRPTTASSWLRDYQQLFFDRLSLSPYHPNIIIIIRAPIEVLVM